MVATYSKGVVCGAKISIKVGARLIDSLLGEASALHSRTIMVVVTHRVEYRSIHIRILHIILERIATRTTLVARTCSRVRHITKRDNIHRLFCCLYALAQSLYQRRTILFGILLVIPSETAIRTCCT